jgi:hypothetical protein
MTIAPKLSSLDRIAYLAWGPGMVAYAFLGGVDKVPVQALFVVLGIVFWINAIGGT